ncbi:beta-galactosidase [Brachybacterium saurashtrense]|uniref:Beta-galactosidase n=1 Tax=Brachybacterium saurashtrense TaxID=556288 RepID=A0A345YST0_9MICO|nr:beta-galactosidase [Brachybacterium saurashtrense]AXK46982.1 beta-galactosidase [Brachybacterium saurashtrense]RRR22697.1 beta-galactosidase [Brachybacterium saurashtrense]
MTAARPWPLGIEGIAYGGDYNPEQWPREVRLEDIALMREAGVTLLSVGIFSWAALEPREGEYEFEWLDEVLDLLAEAGIRVALATATASPPPWLTHQHPELLPVTAEGTVLSPGGRQAYAVSSPVFRDYAVRMTRVMAERYAEHPALALWHVDNELGCHVPHDFSDHAAAAFRRWLERRYGTIEALNEAWGTAFWSQRYSDFAQILPPRAAPTYPNPTQQLDFARYSSDELLAHYRALREVLAEVTPHVPATTNFMLSSATKWMDYFSWAEDVDVVANDHYLIAADPRGQIELAFAADLSRGVAGGDPWILMEHSTSAVNWQSRNRAKGPGEMLRNSLSHLARGADGIMFFQWRQSRAGAEKFHSAMVPHAGTESEVWRGTVALGRALEALAPVRGSRVLNRVALVMDYPSWWASELDSHPTQALRYSEEMLRWYTALWDLGVGVDVVGVGADLTGYELVIAPTLYSVSEAQAAGAAEAARAGAQVVITFFSGIVDEHDQVHLGGYPGAFRDLLGVRSEEFHPLLEGEVHHLDDGTAADLWSERTHLEGAEAVRRWADGPLHGLPAVTRNPVGEGAAWYVAARPSAEGLGALVAEIVAAAGVEPAVAGLHRDVEAVRRFAEDGTTYLFVLNHSERDQVVQVSGEELLRGTVADGALTVHAGAVAVIRER